MLLIEFGHLDLSFSVSLSVYISVSFFPGVFISLSVFLYMLFYLSAGPCTHSHSLENQAQNEGTKLFNLSLSDVVNISYLPTTSW